MRKTGIGFVLLVLYVPFSRGKTCQIRTTRNETKDVCCADFEKQENVCIACLEGYTSDTGKNCKPCPKNTYGEKCGYVCSCLDFKVCDNVKGCVPLSSTTGSSMYATADASEKRSSEKNCYSKTESGEKLKVCCADFEEKGNDCNACLKGFTSDMGQQCRPCSDHFYGEKCGFKCFCTDYEMCDHVKGCVPSSSTSGHSAYVTSVDRSMTWMATTATHSGNDNTTWFIVSQTNGKNMDSRNEDLLSGKIITYYTLTLMVVVPGICLCIMFYKYKTKVTQKRKAKQIKPQKRLLLQNSQNIEMEESLYDNIDETDMLGLIEQIEIASDRIDVMIGSNSTGSGENTSALDEGRTQKNDNLRLPHEYDTSFINARQTVPVMCFSNNPERVFRSCDNLNTAKLIICKRSYDRNTISAEENMLASYNISKTKSESDIFCNQIVTKKLFS